MSIDSRNLCPKCFEHRVRNTIAAILHAVAVLLCRAGCVAGDAADAIERRAA